jgi:chemotaxis protein MotB
MRALKLSVVSIVCAYLLLITGCESPQQKDLRIQNDTQRKRIAELESELQATNLQLEQAKRQLADAQAKGGIEVDTLQQKIAALEEDLAKKKGLIATMQQRLGVALPVELSTKLEDFAKANEQMVSFDANTGIVKFKSDLLFEKGSDKVATTAAEAVKSLCGILNSEEGKKFDIIIAGHTDDIPILKPDTRAQHPTNWHLSADRAISVLDVMGTNNIDPKRMSVRGFSEYRPVAPNAPGKKGSPQNRRVEIYIVPEGV